MRQAVLTLLALALTALIAGAPQAALLLAIAATIVVLAGPDSEEDERQTRSEEPVYWRLR